jgi:hypothetical protein
MQEISSKLSTSMHELRAAELGISPEELALQNEIQMAARSLQEQGMSDEQITQILQTSLQMRAEAIAGGEAADGADGKKKDKKKKNKKKKNKKAGASAASTEAGDDEDEDDEEEDAAAAAAPAGAAGNKWDDVE